MVTMGDEIWTLYGSAKNFRDANQLSYKALYYNSQFYVTTIFCQLFIYLFILRIHIFLSYE